MCQSGVKRLCRAKVLGRDFLEAMQMFCVVMDVSLELGYGSGIANRKHAVSLTYLVGLAYSLKNLPSKAVGLSSRQPVASTTTVVLTNKLSQETREETSCKERRLSAKDLATTSFSDSRSALANSARRRPKYAP